MHWLSTKKAKTGLLAPTLIIYTLFIIIPVAVAIYYSFTEYTGLGKAAFIGLENYFRMFQDRLFLIALKNTFLVLCASIVFLMVGSFSDCPDHECGF